ncbi:MAG: DEAD/DEAH box helicase, partial [Polyangiales bacterium]
MSASNGLTPAATPAAGAYVDVAMPLPLRHAFCYRHDATLVLQPGQRVLVPFRGRKTLGVVLATDATPPPGLRRIEPVLSSIDAVPALSAELLYFLRRAAHRYRHPIGEVLHMALPVTGLDERRRLRRDGVLDDADDLRAAGSAARYTTLVELTASTGDMPRLGRRQQVVVDLLQEHGRLDMALLRHAVPQLPQVLRTLEKRDLVRVLRDAERPAGTAPPTRVHQADKLVLSPAQQTVVDALCAALDAPQPPCHLLHGVTGSGKTEVYLRVIEAALAQQKGAIVLVPEIALTPQLAQRFTARFGASVTVLHSGLRGKARQAAWWRLRRGEAQVVVGARSAIFAPVPALGVVVV